MNGRRDRAQVDFPVLDEYDPNGGRGLAAASAFREDLARCPGGFPWTNRTLWSIGIYRLGRKIVRMRTGTLRNLLFLAFYPLARFVETFTKISLPVFAEIGGGLKITRCGMIFIHQNTVIGRNCTLDPGVTIGNSREDGLAPIIGDDVRFGAYAQVLGGIRIGDGAKIAAMTVVLKDVPANGVAIGIPAKIMTELEAGRARFSAQRETAPVSALGPKPLRASIAKPSTGGADPVRSQIGAEVDAPIAPIN